jgi:hypothetical protein
VNQATSTISTTSSPTPIPTVPPGAAWAALTVANPSLRSWERSAATAGSRSLSWWPKWASGSPLLRQDVSRAIGHEAPPDVFWSAMGIVQRKISDTYQVARQQAEQRQAAEARRQAAQQAPPPPRRKWRAWA